MNSPISLLLSLQEKDMKLAAIKAQLDSAPLEIDALKKEIAKIESIFADYKAEFNALQKRAADMRSERKATEEKIVKYRKQLLDIKSNSDYLALNAEINRMVENVSEMETKELEMMMDIDSGKETLEAHRAKCTADIDILNGKIWTVKDRLVRLESDCEYAQEKCAEAAAKVPEVFLYAYNKVKNGGKKFPIVVKFDGEKCCGCYLKITGDIPTRLADKNQPVLCDQCGRILYS